MPKMIQLRGIPDALHRQLKARAALEGLSLSTFLSREVSKIVQRPSLQEMRDRLAARPVTILKLSPTLVVREVRDRR
jgi:plasmid stability protein